MFKSKIHHIALTVSDLNISGDFYDAILEPLGYSRHSTKDHSCSWTGVLPEILLYKAAVEKQNDKHELYSPGIHHLAFQVPEKEIVDKVYAVSKERGIKILDAPSEYPQYSEGYYALFIVDPDNIKLEIAYIPTPTSCVPKQ